MNNFILKISDYLLAFNMVKRLERINKMLFVFVLLGLSFLTFKLTENEEQYMLYAKQFMNRDWIIADSLNEFAGTRILYQIIIGWLLSFISFEWVLFFSRLVLCVFFSHVLSKIYKELKISNVQVLLHLPILFLTKQSLFAGSWMLIAIEPKGFAWLLVLYALYYFIKKNYKYMVVFLVLGTYMHILVGGYSFLCFMMVLFLFDKSKPTFYYVKLAITYCFLIIPFIIYLKTAVDSTVEYTPSVDWIYSYYRHPHHIGLFKDLSYFYSKHFIGVILSGIALIFSILFFRIQTTERLEKLNQFVLVSLFGVLIAVLIAFFDKEGVIIKYYPFRINTLTVFVLTLILSSLVFISVKKEYKSAYSILIVFLSTIFLLQLAQPNFKNIYSFLTKTDTRMERLSVYVKTETERDAVVLNATGELSLTRHIERDPFIEYKFIPAIMSEIPGWYERVLFKNSLLQDIQVLKHKEHSYTIDFILTKRSIDVEFLELVYADVGYYLYKVDLEKNNEYR